MPASFIEGNILLLLLLLLFGYFSVFLKNHKLNYSMNNLRIILPVNIRNYKFLGDIDLHFITIL
jgi:hypothetical protein